MVEYSQNLNIGSANYYIVLCVPIIAPARIINLITDQYYRNMPKVTSGKKYMKRYTEEDVEKALQAIGNGMGKKTASIKFNVPRATLQFRLSSKFVKNRPGPTTVLTEEDESALVKWIITSSRKGFPRRKEDLIKSVKDFLTKNPRDNNFIHNTPGEGWYKLFMKRHPEISKRTSEAVTSASSKVSETQLRNWFRQIEDYLKENNLFHILDDPSRILNGDETNFILCPKNTKVMAPKGDKNVYEIDHAQAKSCVTVMFTFSADGKVTPPMIIFPLKKMRVEIQRSVPSEWGIGLSDNGWMHAATFFQYIKNVLHPALVKEKTEFPVILFVDGHKSHTTLELSQLCQNLGIILIALYPNATRILQPADVAAFRPIKALWRKAVLEWRVTNLSKTMVKTDVGPILKGLLPKIKDTTLKNGFRTTGLFPFNPDAVDYSKCLVQSKSDNVSPSVEINYHTFTKIVGPELMRKMKNQIVSESKEAKILYQFYKQFYETSIDSVESNNINVATETIESDIVDEMQSHTGTEIKPSDQIKPILGSTSMTIVEPHRNIETKVNTSIVTVPEILDSENEFSCKIYNSALYNIEDLVIPDPEQRIAIISENNEVQTDTPIVEELTDWRDIPTTSRQDLVYIDGKWVPVDDIPLKTVAESPIKRHLNDFLEWPKTPVKKQRNMEHRTFVLTSNQWEKTELERQKKKLEVIQKKEDNKRLRLEKAEEKRLNKERKQAETLNKKSKKKQLKIKKEKENRGDYSIPNKTSPNVIIKSIQIIKQANSTTNLNSTKNDKQQEDEKTQNNENEQEQFLSEDNLQKKQVEQSKESEYDTKRRRVQTPVVKKEFTQVKSSQIQKNRQEKRECIPLSDKELLNILQDSDYI